MVEDGEVDGESQESGQLPVQASDGDMIEDDITEDLYRKWEKNFEVFSRKRYKSFEFFR